QLYFVADQYACVGVVSIYIHERIEARTCGRESIRTGRNTKGRDCYLSHRIPGSRYPRTDSIWIVEADVWSERNDRSGIVVPGHDDILAGSKALRSARHALVIVGIVVADNDRSPARAGRLIVGVDIQNRRRPPSKTEDISSAGRTEVDQRYSACR